MNCNFNIVIKVSLDITVVSFSFGQCTTWMVLIWNNKTKSKFIYSCCSYTVQYTLFIGKKRTIILYPVHILLYLIIDFSQNVSEHVTCPLLNYGLYFLFIYSFFIFSCTLHFVNKLIQNVDSSSAFTEKDIIYNLSFSYQNIISLLIFINVIH